MRFVERTVDISGIHISDEEFQARSTGLHVSDIIRYMSEQAGLHEGSKFDRGHLYRFAMVGRLFETVMARSLFRPPVWERLGEIECDGITGSPDAVNMDDGGVAEFKATWKSSSHPLSEFAEYLWQIKSYCHMIGTDRVLLYVLFLCGDWKPPVPDLKAWDITFTKAELRQHWLMLKENAEGAQEWKSRSQQQL